MDLNFVKIHRIGQTISVGTNGFQKTPVVVEIPGEYPQFIALEACGKKAGIFDGLGVGDIVNCKISLRGREWTDAKGEVKVINNIEVWSVARVQVRVPGQDTHPAPARRPAPETEDLPF